MKRILSLFAIVSATTLFALTTLSCTPKEPTQVLLLTERGGHHGPFTARGVEWVEEFAAQNNMVVTEIHNPEPITKEYLAGFDIVLQLDYVPYTWSDEAQAAFEEYIDEGKGNWIGFHHASLLGEFDGWPMWEWFSDFLGGIRYQNYIAELASADVVTENTTHPVMKGIDDRFNLPDDEWYIFDRSPRENALVLATVDESTYQPDSPIKMGDHPVVWVNEAKKAKNVYFLFGHSPKLFDEPNFVKMLSNALLWCAE